MGYDPCPVSKKLIVELYKNTIYAENISQYMLTSYCGRRATCTLSLKQGITVVVKVCMTVSPGDLTTWYASNRVFFLNLRTGGSRGAILLVLLICSGIHSLLGFLPTDRDRILKYFQTPSGEGSCSHWHAHITTWYTYGFMFTRECVHGVHLILRSLATHSILPAFFAQADTWIRWMTGLFNVTRSLLEIGYCTQPRMSRPCTSCVIQIYSMARSPVW